MDLLEYAATLGFDGIGVNEHHQNGYGLMPSPNLIAATLARRTQDVALVVLGNSIALYNPPVRVAEEFAMLDCISGGRLVAGFPVGTSMDTNYCYGQIPALTREKYMEAHDLIMRAWRSREPFAFNGRYNKLRHVNIWPYPIQLPHPPIHIPGGGSVETFDFCIDNTYSYSYLSFTGYIRARALMSGYWDRVAERNAPDTSPYRAGFAQTICVADTDAEAERLYAEHISYFYNRCLHVYPGFADAPGYRTIKTIQSGVLSQYAPAGAMFSEADLEGPDRGRPHHRRQSRDGAPAHGGADQVAPCRPYLLPLAHGRHASRQGDVLVETVRGKSDAEIARPPSRTGERRPVLVQAAGETRDAGKPAQAPESAAALAR